MRPSAAHAAGAHSPSARVTAVPVARLRTRSVDVHCPPQVSSEAGMVTYATAAPAGENTASPATLAPDIAKLWRTTPPLLTRSPVVLVVPVKHAVAMPGPTALSGHDGSAVNAVTTSVTGLMLAEYADCICMSNDPQPQPPVGTRANAMPDDVQLIR